MGFTLDHTDKNMRLPCKLSTAARMPMFFCNIAREFYQLCINDEGTEAGLQ